VGTAKAVESRFGVLTPSQEASVLGTGSVQVHGTLIQPHLLVSTTVHITMFGDPEMLFGSMLSTPSYSAGIGFESGCPEVFRCFPQSIQANVGIPR